MAEEYELTEQNEHEDLTKESTQSGKRKLDFILLPFLCLLFLLNSLDKSNIGNAETAGFVQDAGLTPDDLNTSMAVFFAFFVALQPVGAIVGRYVGIVWVPACMSVWGLCTILHITIHSRTQLILLRIAIAILESGFYPTTVQYLSQFYTRTEFAFRLGFFYGQSTVAGAVGALLSWVVFSTFSNGWRVLFIIEGSLTILVATLGFFWLPKDVGKSWFLNSEERLAAVQRVENDRMRPLQRIGDDRMHPQEALGEDDGTQPQDEDSSHLLRPNAIHTEDSKLTLSIVAASFLQYKIWHLLICNILSAIPATAFAIFLPVVIQEIGGTPAMANLLTAPPFLCATASVLIFTRWSDHIRKRLLPILAGLVILCIGLTLAVLVPSSWTIIRYLSICIVLSGSFIASPLTVAWISDNTPNPNQRAVLLGINGWGNIAGVSSAFLFTAGDAADDYTMSFLITLICALTSLAGYAVFAWMLHRENRRAESRQYQALRDRNREGEDMAPYQFTY